ncbi:A-kinase anchor protein 17A [Cylas formicarius]|uniref:A-kinase anchor protein 17A n=1 Tax=Cylas formicarius TaxID=197179 RepID=UPI00295833CC|nr:A-kinase anchor protein 17A [Cylas formicarius]
MNAFQRCPNTSELEPLYLPQQLYLRPMAKLNISLQLPNVKKLGKSISHWEIMDKLRELIRPDEFTVLKVTKTTIEFVRFEAEVEKRAKLERVISKIDNKMIKLKDFRDLMRVRAAEYRSDFPNRKVWDAFFQDIRNMDEMKPGLRPDTVHISNLPTKWFIKYHLSNDEDMTPSEKIFYRIFEKFGNIRNVDIPTCDPYRKKMKEQISGLKHSSFDKTDFFEGYVQFKDYIGFTKTMDFFRDKKLVRKEDEDFVEVEIKVDFDRSKHLSDGSIRRREIVRDRLVKKAREQEERDKAALEEKRKVEDAERREAENLKNQKEIRRRLREERRKAKILKKLEVVGSDEINEKIAREEKKLLKAQRKLEAIRLVEELFKRIKEKSDGNVQHYDGMPNRTGDELRRLKDTSELNFLTQREKLHHAVKGRVMLKTILSEKSVKTQFSSSSDSELSLEETSAKRKTVPLQPAEFMYGFPYQPPIYPGFIQPPGLYPEIDIYALYRGRGMSRPGSSRGGRRGRGGRFRGNYRGNNRYYPPDYNRYNEHDSRAKSRSYSPRRSSRRSRSRSRRRSYTRSRSRSYSRRRSRSRSSRRSSRSRRSRSKSRSRRSRRDSREKSLSRDKSVDSSKFMTPRQLLEQKARSRSKSWSMPKEGGVGTEKSWSKSPEKTKGNDGPSAVE